MHRNAIKRKLSGHVALVLAFGILAAALPGCTKKAGIKDPVVADVGGRPIKLREVTDYITSLHVDYRNAGDEHTARRRYLDRLIEDELLVIGGYARTLDADIGIIEKVDAEKDKFLLDELYRAEILNKVTIPESAVKDAYGRWFDRVRLLHIPVREQTQADSVMAALKAGADFGDLAAKYSIDPETRFRGGDPGREFAWWDLPEPIAEVAFATSEGALGGPVKTEVGWHIIKVVGKRKLESRDYATMRPTIEATLRRLEEQKRRVAHLQEMRERANFRYDPDVLALWKTKYKAIADTSSLPRDQLPAVSPADLSDAEKKRIIYRFGTDNEVTLGDFCLALVNRSPLERPDPADQRQMDQFAFQNSLYDILREEGLRLKLDESPIYKERVTRCLENSMADQMRNTVLARGLTVTDAEIKGFYEAHPDSFVEPAACHIREVLVYDKAKAESILQQARAGTPMQLLAKDYTQRAGMKQKEGDLGWVSTDAYPDFYRAALALKPGEIAGPLTDGDQYSIIQLLETRPPRPLKFEEAQSAIFDRLQKARRDSVFQAYLDSMKVQHPVVIYEDVLSSGLKDVHGKIDSLGAGG